MSQADLLRLLELAHPGRPRADLLAMIDATPDARPEKLAQKPVSARVGSRPRTDASMERRRSWASSGRLPLRIAARFTLAEHAVLAVVAVEVTGKGECTLTLEHIAALAGVCRSTVKNALREAHSLGLIRVEERRLSAWRNAPNKVTILSPEWLSWLRLTRKGGGVKSVPTTSTKYSKPSESSSTPNAAKGFRLAEAHQTADGRRRMKRKDA
jgi:hypothetical protein